MKTYSTLKNQQPELFECFFAFNNQQFKEGVKKNNLDGKKIFRGGGGLYGTKEGIKKLFDDCENINIQIAKECDPQEAYNYEFNNHECSYTKTDEEAIKIIVSIFGEEKAKTIKRKYAYIPIESLDFSH